MEWFLLLTQATLLVVTGLMVLRVRQELQWLVRQAQERDAELEPLQQQLQHTLREIRATVDEALARLEEQLARAEQVLQALAAYESGASSPPPAGETSVLSQETARVPVERILALAESGCDATEIARQTGVAEGEVTLVLQLRASQPHSQAQDDEKISLGGGIDT